MRINEFLSELLDRSLPLKWDEQPGYLRAYFDVNGKEGMVKFYYEAFVWTIDFFIDGRHDITGQGNELAILSTVSKAVLEFISKHNPNLIAFSARGPSHVKLYKRMIPRLTGYTIDPELSKQAGFGLKKIKSNELPEAVASDADLKARYGDFDPEDKPMLPTTHVGGAPAPTLWTAYDVIRNILGRDRVTDDDDDLGPGMYYVYQSSGPPMFRDTGDGVGSINLPNLDSKAAKDVAQAAHEAYHAYVHSKSQGGVVHANEKIINNLAEKWLRKHLSGPALHVGLEQIVGSRISYGPNHIPTQKENIG